MVQQAAAAVDAAVVVDGIHVKVRDAQVATRPFYAAIGVDPNGRRDVAGLWADSPSRSPLCAANLVNGDDIDST